MDALALQYVADNGKEQFGGGNGMKTIITLVSLLLLVIGLYHAWNANKYESFGLRILTIILTILFPIPSGIFYSFKYGLPQPWNSDYASAANYKSRYYNSMSLLAQSAHDSKNRMLVGGW